MNRTLGRLRTLALASAAGLAAVSPGFDAAAKSPAGPRTPNTATSAAVIEKISGVWVEGRGYDVTYGGSYAVCAQRCLDTAKCVMLEYYRPEKKCNFYDTMRPRKTGGASNVGIRRTQLSGTGERAVATRATETPPSPQEVTSSAR